MVERWEKGLWVQEKVQKWSETGGSGVMGNGRAEIMGYRRLKSRVMGERPDSSYGTFIYFDTFFIFLVRRVTGSIKHTYLLSLFCRCLENCESRHTKIENFPSSILCCWYRIPGEMNSRHFTPSNL